MKTLKRIPLGIFTLSASPHDSKGMTYRDIFRFVYNKGLIAHVGGDEYAYIASCIDLDESHPERGVTGEIHRYTEIKGDWENLTLRKAATDKDLKELNIPKHLRPNREVFRYILFLKEHRVVVQLKGEKRSISHLRVQKVLQELFSSEAVQNEFKLVSVTVEQEPESLEQIFALPRLDHLTIHVVRPNAGDSFEEGEIRQVEELLTSQNAATLDIHMKHAPGESLEPNKENRRIARVAKSFGKVIGKGRDENNRPVQIDTSEHPVTIPFDYDRKTKTSFVDQMYAAARQVLDRILKREPTATTRRKDELKA